MKTEQKSFGMAFVLWLFLGGLGAHRIYITEKVHYLFWYWLLCICTFGIIVIIDVFRLKRMIENEYVREKVLKSN